MKRFVVGYIVTDVKLVTKSEYDVTPDIVDKWKLIGLPVRWNHTRLRNGDEGIGVVRDWWRDLTYPAR